MSTAQPTTNRKGSTMVTVVRRRANDPAPASTPARHRPRPNAKPVPTKDELFGYIDRYIMTLGQISEYTGLPVRTLSIYHGRGSMPKPEKYIGAAPVWHRDTITDWQSSRPKRDK